MSLPVALETGLRSHLGALVDSGPGQRILSLLRAERSCNLQRRTERNPIWQVGPTRKLHGGHLAPRPKLESSPSCEPFPSFCTPSARSLIPQFRSSLVPIFWPPFKTLAARDLVSSVSY